MTSVSLFLILAISHLPEAALKAQSDTAVVAAPSASSAFSDSRTSGGLAFFAGFHQGLRTETGQKTDDADWLLGASRTIPLGSAWELAPEIAVWHLIPVQAVATTPPHPTGLKVSQDRWNLTMKLALPIRWFPLAGGGHFAAYALLGPAYLFSSQQGGFTLDAGGGLCDAVSRSVALTIEARTYLCYQTSQSVVLASPISIMVGARWTLAK